MCEVTMTVCSECGSVWFINWMNLERVVTSSLNSRLQNCIHVP